MTLRDTARFLVRGILGLAAASVLLPACGASWSQHSLPRGMYASKKKIARAGPAPVRATLQPSATIAAAPLGFADPSPFYLGARYSFLSLDFLDENRLLFTFRVPGLVHRTGRSEESEGERKIRAVVLHVPDGAIEAETVWTLHDHERYLYMLGDGKFLLRDENTLQIGDASLQLKPYLQFPGPVLWVGMDPSSRYLVTGSSEPAAHASKPGEVQSPGAAQASMVSDAENAPEQPDLIVRILRRDDGKVMLVSHVKSAVRLPINGEGYLELLRGKSAGSWTLNFNYFTGGSTIVGTVASVCAPELEFVSPREVLATGCNSGGAATVTAVGLNGKRLWEDPAAGPSVWPLMVTNTAGTRLARVTLLANHGVSNMRSLEPDDIRGQDVEVLDAATGKQVLRAAASPIFDAGGNVAISPTGRRVVIVMDGQIRIFDLPEPAALPDLGVAVGSSR
ncbi:MAG TPA: hypothetical protein VGJ21_25475 [Terracidiphilus sp.]